jgi:hypothetical protein
MTSTSANIFSEKLENLKNTFINLMSDMETTIVNHKLYPDDQTFSSNYDNFMAGSYTCNKNLATLNTEVNDNITISNQILNELLSQLDSSNNYTKIIPALFNKKNASNDMKIDNMNLYNYQILLNWEMFIGMFFLFLCVIWYYRKYYDTKQVIEYTKQKMVDIKEDVSNNIKTAQEEITKMTEAPPQTPTKELPKTIIKK